jgi:hypothetical protein
MCVDICHQGGQPPVGLIVVVCLGVVAAMFVALFFGAFKK